MEVSTIFLVALVCIVVIGFFSIKFSRNADKKTPEDLNDVG